MLFFPIPNCKAKSVPRFKRMALLIFAFCLLFPVGFMPMSFAAEEPQMSTAIDAYHFSFTSNDGTPLPLAAYRGKVLLIVNTASQCGFTPQYADLEKLYETYKERGLVVLGVPSDDFGGQEPGTDQEIKDFTTTKFHVTFPLTAKTDVVGDKRHPFYAWAEVQNNAGVLGRVPRWNFHKFLVDRDGRLVDSFLSTTSPMSGDVTAAVEKALAQK